MSRLVHAVPLLHGMVLAYFNVSAWLFLLLSGSCAKEHLAPYAHSGRPLSPQAKQGLLDFPPIMAIGMIGGGVVVEGVG